MEAYIREYVTQKGFTVRYLCVKVNGVEITLGYLDRFNNLHSYNR